VAQRLALLAPDRALSLTSIMSSSGARGLPNATPEVTRLLLSRPTDKTPEATIAHSMKLFQTIGSPGFPMSDEDLRAAVSYSHKRSYYPHGILRQMMAVVADTERAKQLAHITTPTLVVHGDADPLVPMACGQDTARRIPGARFEAIAGMGHNLPPGVIERLVPLMTTHMTTHKQAV
jgi:pimeloyl-ACP methyl ester carboxylesterase